MLKKITTTAMILGAALTVAACGSTDNAANTADTNMTDMNTMDSSAGMTNDMSAMDATGGNMAMDNAMMGGNDMAMNNAM